MTWWEITLLVLIYTPMWRFTFRKCIDDFMTIDGRDSVSRGDIVWALVIATGFSTLVCAYCAVRSWPVYSSLDASKVARILGGETKDQRIERLTKENHELEQKLGIGENSD